LIRHLARLTRAVGDGSRLAVAVYAEPDGDAWRERPAIDQGFEGVACVDDAARAAIVHLRLIAGGDRSPATRRAARGLVAFVGSMQDRDGLFVNFITDWNGRHNLDGPTSRPGGPWSARAVHALAVAAPVLRDPRLATASRRGLDALGTADENLDVHAVAALARLELWRASRAPADAAGCLDLCDRVLDGRRDGVLRDVASDADVHLWGHLQEAALAEAGADLDEPWLVEAARQSADAVLVPALPRLATADAQPFEASCTATGLAAVARATGDPRYGDAARRAAGWFLGLNAAGRPVYDSRRGVVFDGVDCGRVSRNAGAEASIEGANVMLLDLGPRAGAAWSEPTRPARWEVTPPSRTLRPVRPAPVA
jgi:hypothetical protein